MNKAVAAGFAATPGDLRQIVLDYLCDNCYADTAQVLARDSSTRELDRDGDEVLTDGGYCGLDPQFLREVQLRKDIKTHLLLGQIEDAVKMLNLHFPTVLAPMTNVLRPDPAHLFLNLRIQNFIEESRTIPLPWPSDMLLHSSPSTQNSSPVKRHILLDQPCSSTSNLPVDESRTNRLFSLMNDLHSLKNALPVSADRAIYHNELVAVGGLLAYPIPEESRVLRKYLDMGRREAVADHINEAILLRADPSRPSVVERIARQTTCVFETLHSLRKVLPPPDQRPHGTESFLCEIARAQPKDAKDSKSGNEKDSQEVVPLFELAKLLGSET